MRRFAVLAFVGATAAAQTTHVVGPGGFATIGAALAAASPGDVILVHPGTYPAVDITKGVTIRAVVHGSVSLGNGSVPSPAPQNSVNAPPDEQVHLVSLDMPGLTITNSTASLDGCRLVAYAPPLRVQQSTISLQSCTLQSWHWATASPALEAVGSHVSASVTTFQGGNGNAEYPTAPAPGIVLQGSTLIGGNLVITGGCCWTPSVPALRADAASSAWLRDTTLTAYGTCPITGPVRHDRCTLQPSCGGSTGPVLGVRRTQALRDGQPFTLTFGSEPNALLGVFASSRLAGVQVPGIEQPVFLAIDRAWPAGLLVASATGVATVTWNIPAGFVDDSVWMQALAGPALPLRASPVTGGIVR